MVKRRSGESFLYSSIKRFELSSNDCAASLMLASFQSRSLFCFASTWSNIINMVSIWIHFKASSIIKSEKITLLRWSVWSRPWEEKTYLTAVVGGQQDGHWRRTELCFDWIIKSPRVYNQWVSGRSDCSDEKNIQYLVWSGLAFSSCRETKASG